MEYNAPPFKENERLSRLAIKHNNRENRKQCARHITRCISIFKLAKILSEVEKRHFCMTIANRILFITGIFPNFLKMKMRNKKKVPSL